MGTPWAPLGPPGLPRAPGEPRGTPQSCPRRPPKQQKNAIFIFLFFFASPEGGCHNSPLTRPLAPRSLPGASGWHHRSTMKWQKAPWGPMNPPGLPQGPGPPPSKKNIFLGWPLWRWPLALAPGAVRRLCTRLSTSYLRAHFWGPWGGPGPPQGPKI